MLKYTEQPSINICAAALGKEAFLICEELIEVLDDSIFTSLYLLAMLVEVKFSVLWGFVDESE